MTDEEITRAVAEKVMGWEWWEDGNCWLTDGDWVMRTFDPLTDDWHACAVLDKMAHMDCHSKLIHSGGRDEWFVCFWRFGADSYSDGQAFSVSRNRAICEAALRTVGAWREEP